MNTTDDKISLKRYKMLGLISEIENPMSLDLYSIDTMHYDKSKRNII